MTERILFRALASILFLIWSTSLTMGQCAMCKAAAEQATDGETGSYNAGILYLMVIPYILFFFLGFFWYKQSRKNRDKREQIERQIKKHIPTYSSN